MFKIEMTKEDNLKLKRAQYEKDSIADLIARNMNSTPNQFWLDKLVDANIVLEDCKQEMTRKYIAPNLSPEDLAKASWSANFIEHSLEVTVNE